MKKKYFFLSSDLYKNFYSFLFESIESIELSRVVLTIFLRNVYLEMIGRTTKSGELTQRKRKEKKVFPPKIYCNNYRNMVLPQLKRKSDNCSWREFHRKYHSEEFKYSANNSKILNFPVGFEVKTLSKNGKSKRTIRGDNHAIQHRLTR